VGGGQENDDDHEDDEVEFKGYLDLHFGKAVHAIIEEGGDSKVQPQP